ncbi:MAG: NAD-dependent isocitrate dehydrogenase [ANME-2 cluster archaeon]|jgi:methanogen homoisocitrate dehydrogenase|nr:NAD-dependent isocitrate dehydrogenase [ANME-2 cluster archaeon]
MKVAVIEGDGIGKEVIPAAVDVLNAVNLDFEPVPVEVGYDKWERTGLAMDDADLELMRSCDCILFGAITTPNDPNYQSVLLRIRQELDLYANIRPFRPLGITMDIPYKPAKPFDIIIVRENTEGLYAGIEDVNQNRACSTRVVTRKGCLRIAKTACKLAKGRGNSITIVHKANVLKSCGFFRELCIEVANENGVRYNEMLVDAMAYSLVLNPERYDVIVTTNLFGDILSDLCAALVGSLGLCPSANIGDKYALFEPVHGSAPDIAGKGIANPLAAILSAKMMLEWAGEFEKAGLVQSAVDNVLQKGLRTVDLGGSASTNDMTKAIVEYIRSVQ